jgi:protocatechuate 3,4-dioxygenase beta subunit
MRDQIARLVATMLILLPVVSVSQETELPDCEWCGATEAPESLSWKTVVASDDEPGQRMIISGRVFKADGRTPAEGVILYVNQTARNKEKHRLTKRHERDNKIGHFQG